MLIILEVSGSGGSRIYTSTVVHIFNTKKEFVVYKGAHQINWVRDPHTRWNKFIAVTNGTCISRDAKASKQSCTVDEVVKTLLEEINESN